MSEEWRTIPEFPTYQITSDGDVRNRWTKNVLNEIENKKNGSFSYCLWREDGTSTHRNYWGLIYSAWPELMADWKTIPGFPGYQVNKEGQVRGTRFYKILPVTKSGSVRLIQNGKRHFWSIGKLGDKEQQEEFWREEKIAA